MGMRNGNPESAAGSRGPTALHEEVVMRVAL
jgi:hypothetical protein